MSSTYCLVAACKLLVGAPDNVNVPVIVLPDFNTTSAIKLALFPIAAAISFRVSNNIGAPAVKLLSVVLTAPIEIST